MWLINKKCSKLFGWLGCIIGNNPKVFIAVPVVVAFGLSLGLFAMDYNNEIEFLYTLTNGEAWDEHHLFRTYFPMNSTDRFTPSRLVSPGRFARLIVQREDGGSILNSETWSELLELDEVVRNVSIEWEGESLNYSDLCASWNGVCYRNEHLGLGLLMDQIEKGSLRVSYPVMFNPVSYETYTMNLFFSGFQLVNGSTVASIQFIALDYFARNDTAEDDKRGRKWEETVVDRLGEMSTQWRNIKVAYTTYSSIGNELERNTFSAFPYLSVSFCFVFLFVMVTSWTGDWVTAKPLVSALGIISAFLGAVASAGLLCLIGIPFIGLNAAVPFIALGVGVDDTFVMLSAWWRTSAKDSVHQRLSHAYSEAAVSITITTLTDVLSFYVGILSPTPCVQIFCIYAGTCVLFIYIWHIFFFGGVMALSGQLEEQQRHALFFWTTVTPKDNEKSVTNGPETQAGSDGVKENVLMAFFRDSYFPFLNNKCTQVVVFLTYAVYIGISAWGVTQMQEGLKLDHLARGDSYMVDYFHLFDTHFRAYPYRSQVAITTPLDYSKKKTQDDISNYLKNITSLKSMTPEYGENWLTDFLRFVDNHREFYNFNISSEEEFIDTLRTYYLRESSPISEDVKFNDNFTKIIATRYIIQHHDSPDAAAEKTLLIAWRDLAQTVKEEMEVTAFYPFDMLLDVSVVLPKMTLTLVTIAAGIVMAVAVLFIPNIICILLVFLAIASVEIGVLGFIVFWGINLDIISVITLIMCIGFSVDFSAHVSYAYIVSGGVTAEDRVREVVHSLGLPILQGALSTVVALSGLYFLHSYIFTVFLKVVILVMIFSVYIALMVLPIVLLIFKPDPRPKCSVK